MIRRLAPAAILSIGLLAGCGTADEPVAPTTQTAAPTVEASDPAASTPETTAAAPSTEPATTPTDQATPPATEEPTAPATEPAGSGEDEHPDLVDGVRTNAFNRMPKEVAKLPQVESNTSPADHTAEFNYFDGDVGRVYVMAKLLPREEGGEIVPLTSMDDPRIETGLASARDSWDADGFTLEEFSVEAGEMTWECLLAAASQGDGTLDHAFCLSHRYGRVIEVQTFFEHEADDSRRPESVIVALADVSAGLDGVKS